MESPKYPKTYYMPASPGKPLDIGETVRINDMSALIGQEVVCTEKLDGSNMCFTRHHIFARSHNGSPIHPSFDYAKYIYSMNRWALHLDSSYFFEYLYAVHSIRYTSLPSYLFLLGIRDDRTMTWASHNDICAFWQDNFKEGGEIFLPPTLFKGILESPEQIYDIARNTTISAYGPEREGVVVRATKAFHQDNFQTHLAKWVRKNHVQTDEHWSHKSVEKQGRI